MNRYVGLGLLAALATGHVHAQEATTAPAGDLAETVIITATRRAQTLDKVPAAVSIYAGEALGRSGTNDLRALNQLAPSLTISSGGMEQTSGARIRGVGTVGENVGLESSVGVFVDGVFRPRAAIAVTELGEVQQIELLRGPQGTLFGRNASAGLINIVTPKPSRAFGGTASAGYGAYNALRLAGSVTGPVGTVTAVSLDGTYQRRDGFLTDTQSGRQVNDRDRYLLRGQVLFTSAEAEIRVIGDYAHRAEECCAFTFIPARDVTRQGANVVTGPSSLLSVVQSLGGAIDDRAPRTDRVSISAGRTFDTRVKDYGISIQADWSMGDIDAVSISAYRVFDGFNQQDVDFNGADILHRDRFQQRFNSLSQEVRLQGTAHDRRIEWLIGGYFAHERLRYFDGLRYGTAAAKFLNCLVVAGSDALRPTLNIASPTCSAAPVAAFPGYDGLAALLGAAPLSGTGRSDSFRHNGSNYAFFTHNIFHIDDFTEVTFGLRYTDERKRMKADLAADNTLCTATATSASPSIRALAVAPCGAVNALVSGRYEAAKSEHRWTGTAILSRALTSDLSAYASFARGYKAGGFNLDRGGLTVGTPSASQLAFDPETVDAFELGAKQAGILLSLRAAAFHQRFANFQLNTFNGINFVVENIQGCRDALNGADHDVNPATGACPAGRTRSGVISEGVELEAAATPRSDLSLSAGLTYAHTRYRKDLVGSGGRALTPVLFQLPGRALSNAARYIATSALTFTPPLASGFSGLFYADMRYQSAMAVGSDLDIEKRVEPYTTVNARVGLGRTDDSWSVDLWVRNLFAVRALQMMADVPLHGSGTFRGVAEGVQPAATQLYAGIPIETRTFGVAVRSRF